MPRPVVRTERRLKILNAAMQVFLQKGFEAARMEEIAAASDLSIGGMYWYYRSKDQLIHDLVSEIIDRDLGDLRLLLDQPGTVIERLEGYIRAGAEAAAPLGPLFHEIYSMAGRVPQIRSQLKEYLHAYIACISNLLEQGVETGEFGPLDIGHTATLFAALYEGMLELALFDPGQIQPGVELGRSLQILCQGLLPRQPGAGTNIEQ